MEDCCAVCVEPLEWVGYGPCGHRDVCSVCIARLRFVLGDKQCCICKQDCPSVFVTKALGDYTKSIDNFEALADQRNLWRESNIQAYFDDEDHFKMIKNMCRLSCSVCEAAESPGKDYVKKGHIFRNLDQLRRHLFNAHKVHMCGLCLEGRKVFICEQKLYSKKQLDRHLQNGNSDIDLNDEDRGWFNGHPLCNFCHSRFYGDNELYQHMSTEHFTCHICQRLRPGQYDYYRNYDDLEAHFRHDHALCEHPDCLDQKFIVFGSDADLKRHNALVHGGNMSRAQRNAALQIPVSFQYRRPNQDNSRGAGRPFRRREAYSEEQIQSTGFQNTTEHVNDEPVHVDSTEDFPHFQNTETPLPAPSSASRISNGVSSTPVEPSRYRTAVSRAGPSSLQDSAFPPLQSVFPPLPGSESRQQSRGSPISMASVLGRGVRRPSQKANPDQVGTSVRESPGKFTSQPEDLSQWPQVSASQRPQFDTPVVRQSVGGRAEGISNNRLVSSDTTSNSSDHLDVEEIRAANKALRESIHSVLQGDGDRYNEFKLMSAQFRSGEMVANTYLHHVKGFGLLHLVPELARLCPDPRKKEDLLKVFRTDSTGNQVNGSSEPLASSGGSSQDEDIEEIKKITLGGLSSLRLTDQGGGGYSEENEVEVLSRDGYRDLKGKKLYSRASNGSSVQSKPAKVLVKARTPSYSPSSHSSDPVLPTSTEGSLVCRVCTLELREGSTHCAACGTPWLPPTKPGGSEDQSKEKRKNKKATKLRMGDGSAAAVLDSGRRTWDLNNGALGNVANGLTTSSGAWGNGGGQSLVSSSQRQTDTGTSSSNRRV
ncbi:hypothetical protein GOP47_0013835 [Adiantum capillus-veneris]|uniref:RING-type E3 ubiquitin transferase n=1 Tax=Adiantum capillus-veneris TaxID=13818 RepID=A0A9D4UPA0_ADICA|nr:hypothetical protein GOP47_0013835 [Adiantum capillus-veneris]